MAAGTVLAGEASGEELGEAVRGEGVRCLSLRGSGALTGGWVDAVEIIVVGQWGRGGGVLFLVLTPSGGCVGVVGL